MTKYTIVDAGYFFRRDPIAHAEDVGTCNTGGLYSRNVKRSYNGRKAAKRALGVTSGYVEGTDTPTIDHTWSENVKPIAMSNRARKRAAARARYNR